MEVSAVEGFRQRKRWLVVLAALLAAQGCLTLRLFSHDSSVDPLLDDRPILSGKHALHFYHGGLGARTWLDRGTSCCYDPAYQAGYPKTPIFDAGSRPAELFQIAGGPNARSYKIGMALLCLLVPAAYATIARGINLSVPTACLAGLLGATLFWTAPNRHLLEEGDLDLLLGGLALLVHVAWLIRFERMPGLDSWSVMTAAATLAWYTQPVLVLGFLPILILYYLWVALRQGLIWHLALVAAIGIAFGINAAWLHDWVRYLWIYVPYGGGAPASFAPLGATLTQHWNLLLPSDPVHIGIGALGLIGLLAMLGNNRAAAWVFGLATLGYTLAGDAGKLWPPLTEFGTDRLLLIAAWCLVCPAAVALARVARHFGEGAGVLPLGALVLLVALAALAWSTGLPRECWNRPALDLGWNPERQKIIEAIRQKTTVEARILWEDRQAPAANAGWTALLAPATERAFLGGLDPVGRIEHMYARLCDGKLAGRPIADWSDAELLQFADRYNVSWVACWSKASIERFRKLARADASPAKSILAAREIAVLEDGEPGVLFALERRPAFFLKGKGEWIQADWERVALANVIPENGEVILSLHHQSNWRVSPVYVHMEQYDDLDDPRPFVRLRMPGPVHRLTLVWENP